MGCRVRMESEDIPNAVTGSGNVLVLLQVGQKRDLQDGFCLYFILQELISRHIRFFRIVC